MSRGRMAHAESLSNCFCESARGRKAETVAKPQEITISSCPSAIGSALDVGDSVAIFVLRRDGDERDIAECDARDESDAMTTLGKLIGHGLSREAAAGG